MDGPRRIDGCTAYACDGHTGASLWKVPAGCFQPVVAGAWLIVNVEDSDGSESTHPVAYRLDR